MMRYNICIGNIAHISCVSVDHDFIPPGGCVGQIRVANGNKKYVTIRYHLGTVQLLPPMKLSFQIASTITNQRNNLFIRTPSGVLTINQYRLLDRYRILALSLLRINKIQKRTIFEFLLHFFSSNSSLNPNYSTRLLFPAFCLFKTVNFLPTVWNLIDCKLYIYLFLIKQDLVSCKKKMFFMKMYSHKRLY